MIRFKKDDGSQYPDYKKMLISDVFFVQKGAPISKADISSTGNPVILYGELYTTYGEIATDVKKKTEVIVDDKYKSKIGDVLIPTSGESAIEISKATCVMKDDVILGGDLNIYRSKIVDGRYFSYLVNNPLKCAIAKMAQGVSIVHLQSSEIGKIEILVPDKEEQQKIANFLSKIDEMISIQSKQLDALKEQKKGVMQKIFSQEVRFKDENGEDYPDWENKKLGDVFTISDITNNKNNYSRNEVLSVSDEFGVLNQIKFHGRSFAGEDISGYKIAKTNQIIYTKAPLSAKPFGIIKIVQDETGIVSPLYIVNNVVETSVPLFWYYYFDTPARTNNYLKPLVRKGAKNTMNITNDEWLSGKVKVPCFKEQEKIANLLSTYDKAIENKQKQLDMWKTLKKGLMQELFDYKETE